MIALVAWNEPNDFPSTTTIYGYYTIGSSVFIFFQKYLLNADHFYIKGL